MVGGTASFLITEISIHASRGESNCCPCRRSAEIRFTTIKNHNTLKRGLVVTDENLSFTTIKNHNTLKLDEYEKEAEKSFTTIKNHNTLKLKNLT